MTGFLIIFAMAAFLMILERIFPDQKLPEVKGWWPRVIALNAIQLALVLLATATWEKWLQGHSLFHLRDHMGVFTGGAVAYFCSTFMFYWWHRARHEINIFWLLFHQVHHSPQRIETATSFYKHPLEIMGDSILMSALLYPVLGLTLESSIWLSVFSAFGEFFYHVNIKTPYWWGFIFQRPESHRVHHQRDKHYKNFADLPLWDILFGTFENPRESNAPCGYKPEREARLAEMMAFKNVNGPMPKKEPIRARVTV